MQPFMPLIIVVLALCAIVAIAYASRWVRRSKLQRQLTERDNDHVHYAFVINPSKPHAKQTRTYIEQFCESHNIHDVTFIETTLEKDGRACALEALDRGADVVVAVGGDGTVRTVASALSGTGHAMGIIPIGTGNLFSRNLGIPIDDLDAALTVATSHGSRYVDMGRLTLVDHPEEDHGHAFLIIAGIGFDAQMIEDTDPELKKSISWMAYFVGALKHLFAPKYRGTISIKTADGALHTRENLVFRTLMAGNCGQIPGFSLMPKAQFDDGILDFEVIDTTGGIIGWANLFGDVLHQTVTGKASQSVLSTNSTIDQVQGVSAEIVLDEPALAEVDGDILQETQHIRFDIEHKSLCVRVPEGVPSLQSAEQA